MKLSPAERETIILFSDADDTASVYTYDRRLLKKLDALCRKCPEEVYEEKTPLLCRCEKLYCAEKLRFRPRAVFQSAARGGKQARKGGRYRPAGQKQRP